MSEYEVIKKIMETDRLSEKDKVYFVRRYLNGTNTEEQLKVFWE